MRYWVALDCGQSHDYSAAVVVQRTGAELHVTSLDRAPLRTPYPAIARAVVAKCLELEPVGAFGERREIGLIVDAGGVGRAVADLIQQEIKAIPRSRAPRIKFIPATATGGERVTLEGGHVRIPKRELITSAVVALQDARLKIGDVPNAELLVGELQEYRARLTRTGHTSYEGAGRNYDLVYALALATWAWSITPEPRSNRTPRSGPGRRGRGRLQPVRLDQFG